jgi:hypothetical protein
MATKIPKPRVGVPARPRTARRSGTKAPTVLVLTVAYLRTQRWYVAEILEARGVSPRSGRRGASRREE